MHACINENISELLLLLLCQLTAAVERCSRDVIRCWWSFLYIYSMSSNLEMNNLTSLISTQLTVSLCRVSREGRRRQGETKANKARLPSFFLFFLLRLYASCRQQWNLVPSYRLSSYTALDPSPSQKTNNRKVSKRGQDERERECSITSGGKILFPSLTFAAAAAAVGERDLVARSWIIFMVPRSLARSLARLSSSHHCAQNTQQWH